MSNVIQVMVNVAFIGMIVTGLIEFIEYISKRGK